MKSITEEILASNASLDKWKHAQREAIKEGARLAAIRERRTRRDMFAAAALEGILSNDNLLTIVTTGYENDPKGAEKAVSADAVLWVDALIAELDRTEGEG